MTLKLVSRTFKSGETNLKSAYTASGEMIVLGKTIAVVPEFEKVSVAIPFISSSLSGVVLTAQAEGLSGNAVDVMIQRETITSELSGGVTWTSTPQISGSVLSLLVEGY